MRRHFMFMDRKTWYFLNGNTPQIDLQIQCNTYQNLSWLFFRNQQGDSKIYMEIQKTQHSQNNLEKEQI